MRITTIFILILSMLLCSILTACNINTIKNYAASESYTQGIGQTLTRAGNWELKEETDEFGDPTGVKYITSSIPIAGRCKSPILVDGRDDEFEILFFKDYTEIKRRCLDSYINVAAYGDYVIKIKDSSQEIVTLSGDEGSEENILIKDYDNEQFVNPFIEGGEVKVLIAGEELPDYNALLVLNANGFDEVAKDLYMSDEKEQESVTVAESESTAEKAAESKTEMAESEGKSIIPHVYSDDELCRLAREYYSDQTGFMPPCAMIDSVDGDMVTIHLFEDMDDHIATCDWYTVDRKTGIGTDFFGDEINLCNTAYDVDTGSVDIKDYTNNWIEEYGGSLEYQLAGKLNSRVELGEYEDSHVICDGNIEFWGVANGTGFVIRYYNYVPGFSIFGIYPGMNCDEADTLLRDQGMMVSEDSYYAYDFDDYYIVTDDDNQDGIIDRVRYVKCHDRGF